MLTYFRRARNLRRYQKIVAVLARHGFGSFLAYLQADRYLPLPPRTLKRRARAPHRTPSEHLRLALEELGPTFIKLGQILSTRPDILPAEYISELSKLQDRVPPTPWAAIQAMIKNELGRALEEVFASIDPEPLGSASLAQVHAATLLDGRRVVIKVQRPNIAPLISADLDILNDLANLAQGTQWGQLYNPVEIVTQFAFTLQNELDYRREGLNADRFRKNFQTERHLYIPTIHWDSSTQRVLVMERLEGVKIDDLAGLDAAGLDRHQIALHAAGMIVKEVIEDGFFHADPHPGNFVVWRGQQNGEVVIGAMDFGMVGHVSKTDSMNLLQAYSLASKFDAKGIVELMMRMGAIAGHVDMQALEHDLDRLLAQYRGLPLKYIQTRRVIEEVMQLAFHYRITLPPDLWMLLKTLSMMDGLARQLDPEVDIFLVFGPHVQRIMMEARMPWTVGESLLSDLESLALAMRDIPSIGENLLRGLQRGELPLSMTMGASKDTLDRLDRVSTRLSVSVLVTGFILGLALLFPLAKENNIALALVVVGFVAALTLGVWLVYNILRSGH